MHKESSVETTVQPAKLSLRTPLVQRTFLFIVVFLFISGLSGSWVISTQRLLFQFHFDIYGSAGKSLLFGMIVFFLLTKDRVLQLDVKAWKPINTLLCGLSLVLLGIFFFFATQLMGYTSALQVPVLTAVTHIVLLSSVAAAALGIFGRHFFLSLGKMCKKELIATVILATLFYFLFGMIFSLWPYLSKIVLWAVLGLLQFTNPGAKVVPPLTIQLPQFAITIGEYCSGIESLFLITTLYVLIGCLEWNKLHKNVFFLHFFPLIIGMFMLNIVRVFVIIQAGVFFGPQIAAKLFHTYLGMLLFMSYFLVYWKWSAPIILRKPAKTGKGVL